MDDALSEKTSPSETNLAFDNNLLQTSSQGKITSGKIGFNVWTDMWSFQCSFIDLSTYKVKLREQQQKSILNYPGKMVVFYV